MKFYETIKCYVIGIGSGVLFAAIGIGAGISIKYFTDYMEAKALHEQTGDRVMVTVGDGCRVLQEGIWERCWRANRKAKP